MLDKSANDAGLDPDLDGFTNLQEFLAGTDPHNSRSYLCFSRVTISPAGIELRFDARAGRTYSLLYNETPGIGPWQKLADIPAPATDQPTLIVDSSVSASAGRFYRLVTPAAP